MHSKLWDEQIKSIAKDLGALSAEFSFPSEFKKKRVIEKKIELTNLQLQIDNLADTIIRFGEGRFPLPPILGALIHWANVVGVKTREWYMRRAHSLGEFMWIEIIRSRLGQQKSSQFMFEQATLVDLMTRHNFLKNTEAHLTKRIVELKHKREKLNLRYAIVQAKHANRDAVFSMQSSFGKTPRKSLHNPTLKEMGRLVKSASMELRNSTPEERHYHKLKVDYLQKTTGILESCRNLVRNHGKTRLAFGENAQREIEAQMLQIATLENQLKVAKEQAYETPHDEKVPILMKKSQNHVTKGHQL
ncbi:MAG: hypothetical protein AB7T49_18300 [Oligoflexales bacterium]